MACINLLLWKKCNGKFEILIAGEQQEQQQQQQQQEQQQQEQQLE